VELLEDKGALSFVVIRDAGINTKWQRYSCEKAQRHEAVLMVPYGKAL